MPFLRVDPAQVDVQCQATGVRLDTCGIAPYAESTLNWLLGQALKDRPDIALVPENELRAAMQKVPKVKTKDIYLFGLYQVDVGEIADADEVLFGIVFCFKEYGTDIFGQARPAAVGLNLYLMDTRTEKLIWKGCYVKEAEPMTSVVAQRSPTLPESNDAQCGPVQICATDVAKNGMDKLIKEMTWR